MARSPPESFAARISRSTGHAHGGEWSLSGGFIRVSVLESGKCCLEDRGIRYLRVRNSRSGQCQGLTAATAGAPHTSDPADHRRHARSVRGSVRTWRQSRARGQSRAAACELVRATRWGAWWLAEQVQSHNVSSEVGWPRRASARHIAASAVVDSVNFVRFVEASGMNLLLEFLSYEDAVTRYFKVTPSQSK